MREAMSEYEKRLSAYCRFSVKELDDGKPMLPCLSAKAYKIALCVEGDELSSEQLAAMLEKLPSRGVSEITFIIGGFDGLEQSVKDASDFRLSFSRMTFPHQLMRVILSEQIYRAFTIINHGKYHK